MIIRYFRVKNTDIHGNVYFKLLEDGTVLRYYKQTRHWEQTIFKKDDMLADDKFEELSEGDMLLEIL